MFLHISDGKRLRVQLTAETVPQQAAAVAAPESGEAAQPPLPPPPPKQQLLLLHSDRRFVFDAVPIGEETPPLQLFCLRNAGPNTLTYSIDLRPLAAMKEENWGFEVGALRRRCVFGVMFALSAGRLAKGLQGLYQHRC